MLKRGEARRSQHQAEPGHAEPCGTASATDGRAQLDQPFSMEEEVHPGFLDPAHQSRLRDLQAQVANTAASTSWQLNSIRQSPREHNTSPTNLPHLRTFKNQEIPQAKPHYFFLHPFAPIPIQN